MILAAMSRPEAGGPAGSRDVMSIMPATASWASDAVLPSGEGVVAGSWGCGGATRPASPYGWAADAPCAALVTAVYRIVTLRAVVQPLGEVPVTQRGYGGVEGGEAVALRGGTVERARMGLRIFRGSECDRD